MRLKNLFYSRYIYLILAFLNSTANTKTLSISEKISRSYSKGIKISLVPWMKERLHESNSLNEQYNLLQELILLVGSQHFELLADSDLKKHRSEPVAYILGKKLFNKGLYYEAEKYLEIIRKSSSLYPHAQYILGIISVTSKNYARADNHFSKCFDEGNQWMSDYSGPPYVNKQFKMLKDLCQVAKARSYYGQGKLLTSELKFMELDKRSRVWPAILIDEAWMHFYLGNYNRTLGKIVTYNAPQLQFSTHADVSSLASYSYLKMCLYDDVLKISNKYEKSTIAEIEELNEIRRSPYSSNTQSFNRLRKHPSFFFYNESLRWAEIEVQRIRKDNSLGSENELLENLDDFVDFQKNIIARQMKRLADKRIYDLRQTLESLSYLKLEVLGRKKESLYKGKELKGVRGDVKYLKRNQKQYFWDFPGEFWADELGDYVFALASECENEKKL